MAVIVVPPVMRLMVNTALLVALVVAYTVHPASDAGTTRAIAIGAFTMAPVTGFALNANVIGTD
jgi:hypothetical protein